MPPRIIKQEDKAGGDSRNSSIGQRQSSSESGPADSDKKNWQMYWPQKKAVGNNVELSESEKRDIKHLKSDVAQMSFSELQNVDFKSYQKKPALFSASSGNSNQGAD